MASTITLQSVVDWARTQTKMIPIIGVGGFSNEPALTICNNVIQEMLSPPYNWKFNRREAPSFITVDKQQDYAASTIVDMGWLEGCDIEDEASTQTPKPIGQIEVVQSLPRESNIGTPQKMCYLERNTSTTSAVKGPGEAANDASVGTVAWSNASNILADDGAYATNAPVLAATTNWLKASGFGFAIPESAVITGILVEARVRASANGLVINRTAQLLKGGAVGDQKAVGGDITTSPVFVSFGGGTDVWNANWTPADINSPDFGVRIHFVTNDAGTISVDYVRVTVSYTLPVLIWRMSPVPGNQVFRIYPIYQRKAPVKTSLTQTWFPIPDELSFVYRQGFLAMAFRHADDARFRDEYQIFQAMIAKALGSKDAELNAEGFVPSRPLLIG